MKFLIITVQDKRDKIKRNYEYEREELKNLLSTYGVYQTQEMHIKIDRPNPSYYIGSGKIYEIKKIIEDNNIKGVLFNINLNVTQTKNIKEILNVEVMDKTYIILQIFKQRAKTQEGKLQVELANLKYMLSRISGYGNALDQQYGAIGTRGGAGEKKIEYDKRAIRERISLITQQIKKIRTHRQIQREKRISVPYPIISIVGYTNVGKSTLLNVLSKKDNVYADNKLFATLDPTSKKIRIKGGFFGIFTDTVGFIDNLPHLLVMAFSSTLEEIKYSDLIIHLHDITQNIEKHNTVVKRTLYEIGANTIPIINVFNKTDMIKNIDNIKQTLSKFNPIFISAIKKQGINELLFEIDKQLGYKWIEKKIEIKNDDKQTLNYIKNNFFIIEQNYSDNNISLTLKVPIENIKKIEYINEKYKQ